MRGPARLGGARRRLRGDPQEQRGDPRFLGGERQPAARGEVEHGRISPAFDHHRAEAAAAQRVGRAAKQRPVVGRVGEDDAVGIAAQLDQPRRVEPSAAPRGRAGAQPEQRAAAGLGAQREHRSEACGAGRVARIGAEYLVDAPTRDASSKKRIETRMSAREPPARRSSPRLPGDGFPQCGEMAGRLAHGHVLVMF